MNYIDLKHFQHLAPKGILLRKLKLSESSEFIEQLKIWYPQFVVGSESRFADIKFYKEIIFNGNEETSLESRFLPILYIDSSNQEVVGCIFIEKDDNALTVTCPMAAFSMNFRNNLSGLAILGPILLIEIGRKIGAELAYYISTLISVANQKLAEKAGYDLVGIIPAFDRDLLAPGVIKRSPEAIYAKVLAGKDKIQNPPLHDMTKKTQKLWNFLFTSSE